MTDQFDWILSLFVNLNMKLNKLLKGLRNILSDPVKSVHFLKRKIEL